MALGILGVILLLLYGTLSSARRSVDTSERKVLLAHSARSLVSRLRDDLHAAFRMSVPPGIPSSNAAQVLSGADRHWRFYRVGPPLGAGDRAFGLHAVSYAFDEKTRQVVRHERQDRQTFEGVEGFRLTPYALRFGGPGEKAYARHFIKVVIALADENPGSRSSAVVSRSVSTSIAVRHSLTDGRDPYWAGDDLRTEYRYDE